MNSRFSPGLQGHLFLSWNLYIRPWDENPLSPKHNKHFLCFFCLCHIGHVGYARADKQHLVRVR